MEKSSRWAGFPVAELQALRYRIAMQIVGENVQLTVVCAGARFQVDVALVPPPGGAKVASLSPAVAEELGLDSTIYGVVVLEVRRVRRWLAWANKTSVHRPHQVNLSRCLNRFGGGE